MLATTNRDYSLVITNLPHRVNPQVEITLTMRLMMKEVPYAG